MEPEVKAAQYQIKELEELRRIFPPFFKNLNIGSAVSGYVNGVESPIRLRGSNGKI